MAILLALLAAATNALATVLQRLGVEEASTSGTRTADLMRAVLRRPIWFFGLALTTGSFLLQAFAISFGTLSTVQPIMVTEIVFLVIVLGVWFHRSLGWREWVGSAGTAAGLGTFLAVSAANGGTERPSRSDWLLLGIASLGAVSVSFVAARRGSRTFRAACYGLSAAICFALTAAFIKTTSDQWSGNGPGWVFTHPEAYLIAVSGLAGLVISQRALDAGPVAASQSVMLIVNPISSIAMGMLLFGDQLHTSAPRLAAGAVALAVMFAALIVLSQSPLITATGSSERLSEAAVLELPLGGAK